MSRVDRFFDSVFENHDAPMQSRRRGESEEPAGPGPLVLVAEDDPDHLRQTCEVLAQLGITPLIASDGAEAVALACELEFDLILMDLQMPVLDGLGATVQIRNFEREHSRGPTAVVAHTAFPLSTNESFLRDFGVDAVLDKPCAAEVLRECVQTWCTRNDLAYRRKAMSAPQQAGRP